MIAELLHFLAQPPSRTFHIPGFYNSASRGAN